MLEVIEPGLLTTVQDLGRPDFVHLGVPHGGACDPWSLRVANALAGNEPGAPALEMTLAGPTFRVTRDCVIGLAGADLDARVMPANRPLAPDGAYSLAAGETLAFGAAGDGRGIRAYLALAGGIDASSVLGSSSTCLVGRFGGLEGRPLAAGDRLRSASSPSPAQLVGLAGRRWVSGRKPALEAAVRPLRVLPGPDVDRLVDGAFDRFVSSEYTVNARGDRQGLVFDGPLLASRREAGEMLSVGVVWGAVQVPPDGRPICLLADHQTVGGYPVVAVVITADLPALGQLGPGDAVRFSAVDARDALRALREQEAAWLSGTATWSER